MNSSENSNTCGGDQNALRSTARSWLKSQPPESLARASTAIRERLSEEPVFKSAGSILFFYPRWDEPDLWPLVEICLGTGRRAAMLRYRPEGDLYEAVVLTRETLARLEPGRFGIPEPPVDMNRIDLKMLDLALVPGLVFARNAARIGRGRGYFDRFLGGFTGLKAGVCFEGQVVDRVPSNAHDVPMDLVLTESRVYRQFQGN